MPRTFNIIKTYSDSFAAKHEPFYYIGTGADGVRFYEHPTQGDESPLLAKIAGNVVLTDMWEVPTN